LRVGHLVDEDVAVLRDGFSKPVGLPYAVYAFRDERPDHDEATMPPTGDDRKAGAGAFAASSKIMVGPMPSEIERLENMNRFSGALEKGVPIIFESVEVVAGGDQRQFKVAAGIRSNRVLRAVGTRARQIG
jgi:hypothetical protein